MGGVPLKRPRGIDPDMPALAATGGPLEEDGRLEPKKCKHRTSPQSKSPRWRFPDQSFS